MKRIWWIIVGAILLGLSYYLFVRPYEFEVNFTARTSPGDLVSTIRLWNRALKNSEIVEVDSFSAVRQTLVGKNGTYRYDWRFVAVNDSTTRVSIQVSEPGHELMNKILVPVSEPPVEKDAREVATKFHEILQTHLQITSVKIIGETTLESSFCVCREMQTTQIEKANQMMKDYPLLTSFVDAFKLNLAGPPMNRVTEWDHNSGQLKFDFCFPVSARDSLPDGKDLAFKKFPEIKVLKAEYHGNYITSDRAWYQLIQYAKRNGYQVRNLPIEYFHNNPNLGMDQAKWKAEIYLPVQE
jgi:effector-binding domain-containing protein